MLRFIYSFYLDVVAEMLIKVVIYTFIYYTRHIYCRKMYSWCTAEKWQSAVNETVTYNKNGVSDGESRVNDFIYRIWFKCYLPFINRLCQTFDFKHVLSHFEYWKVIIFR